MIQCLVSSELGKSGFRKHGFYVLVKARCHNKFVLIFSSLVDELIESVSEAVGLWYDYELY